MKVAPNNADRFVAAADPDITAVLVYGPDSGLVRERCTRMIGAVVDDVSDPFRVTEIPPSALKDDPARLSDEVFALSMIGGRRAVYLRAAGDTETPILTSLMDGDRFEALLVVEAGDLSPRSSLRKLFEASTNGAAVPCYADDAATLRSLVQDAFSAHDVTVDPEALAYLCDNLGADRMISRMELEKLALFAGEGGRVGIEDAIASVGDSAAVTLDDIAYSVGAGDVQALIKALVRGRADGLDDIAIVRTVQRHFQRLHLCAGRVAAGMPADQAMRTLRPPVFFKRADGFRAQLGRWRPASLDNALLALTDTEIACKSTAMPAGAMCERALLRLATRARRGR